MIFTNNMPTSALQLSEIATQKEAEARKRFAKELAQQQYNAEMKQLSEAAVDETKKNNEIAQQSLKVAQDSKFLAQIAIGLSGLAIFITVAWHLYELWGQK